MINHKGFVLNLNEALLIAELSGLTVLTTLSQIAINYGLGVLTFFTHNLPLLLVISLVEGLC